MRIPKKLKVGGHIYKVDDNYTFKERTDISGQAKHEDGHIRMTRKTQSGVPVTRSKMEQCFIHELLHCVDATYNADKLDEETIMRMSEGLYQVLNDNEMLL